MKKIIFIFLLIILSTLVLHTQTWDFYDLNVNTAVYDMVSDNNGDIHILWKSGIYRLSYGKVTYNSGTSSYEVTGISDFNTTYAIHTRFTRPRLAVKGDGSEIHTTFISTGTVEHLTHVWKDASGWHETVFWKYPDSGTNWYTAFPAIGVDLNGNVHIVAQLWNDHVGGDRVIYWRKPNGGSWSAASIVQTNDAQWRDVSAYTDKNGGFHATWKTGQVTYGVYKYAANGSSLTSSPTIQIPNLGSGNSYQDMVSFGETYMAPNGDVHHAYTHYNDVTLRHTIKPSGSNTFNIPTKIADINNSEHGGSYKYENPWCTLGIMPNGTPLVGWAENRGSGDVNYINLAVLEGSSWVTYEVDNLAKIDSEGRPVLAITDTKAYMIWRRNTGYLRLAVSESSNPTITVTSPNGGENLGLGRLHNITWSETDLVNNLKITLWKDSALVGNIAKDIDPSLGTFSWTIGNYVGGTVDAGTGYQVKIKEVGTAVADMSDSTFNISTPSLTVTYPNGGERLGLGSQKQITWNSVGLDNNLKITLWKGGSYVGLIANNVVADLGTYLWTVGEYSGGTASLGTDYTIKIKEKGTAVADTSDSNFEITQPSITVASPNGNESWYLGETKNITWSQDLVASNLKITLWKGGVLVGKIATNVNYTSGSYSWDVGKVNGNFVSSGVDYTIKIKEIGTAVSDTSNAYFNILASSITVTKANGGEIEKAGTLQTITWTSVGVIANVKVESSPDGGTSWVTLAESIPNTGTYSDILPVDTPPLSTYLLRITNASSGYPSDVSDGTFTILPPDPLHIISPNGGEVITIGNSYDITWTHTGLTNNLKITLWKGGVLVGLIAKNIVPSTGSYSWTAGNHTGGTVGAATDYTIKIKEIGTANADISDANFELE